MEGSLKCNKEKPQITGGGTEGFFKIFFEAPHNKYFKKPSVVSLHFKLRDRMEEQEAGSGYLNQGVKFKKHFLELDKF